MTDKRQPEQAHDTPYFWKYSGEDHRERCRNCANYLKQGRFRGSCSAMNFKSKKPSDGAKCKKYINEGE